MSAPATPVATAARYIVFAAVATVLNLGAQRLVLAGWPGALLAAMIAGTGVGLIAKYLLDKRFIFDDRREGIAVHGRLFFLYTAMGGITTLLFWATEYGFWRIGQSQSWREAGALLGLGLGYGLKYLLDRRFVFASREVRA